MANANMEMKDFNLLTIVALMSGNVVVRDKLFLPHADIAKTASHHERMVQAGMDIKSVALLIHYLTGLPVSDMMGSRETFQKALIIAGMMLGQHMDTYPSWNSTELNETYGMINASANAEDRDAQEKAAAKIQGRKGAVLKFDTTLQQQFHAALMQPGIVVPYLVLTPEEFLQSMIKALALAKTCKLICEGMGITKDVATVFTFEGIQCICKSDSDLSQVCGELLQNVQKPEGESLN